MAVFMAMEGIGPLHVPAPAALGDDAGVIGPFHRHAAVAIQPMVDIHAAIGHVYVARSSARAHADVVTAPGVNIS
jgi:hypothetical protein